MLGPATAPLAATRCPEPRLCMLHSVSDLPGFSRDFDCFDSILEWDGISGMEVVFDSLFSFAVLIV